MSGRECLWCGDWESQHNDRGCVICGRYPWERGIYRCDGFIGTVVEREAREDRLIKALRVPVEPKPRPQWGQGQRVREDRGWLRDALPDALEGHTEAQSIVRYVLGAA